MRISDDRPAAPNYTTACVVMFGVNLSWVLLVIWSIWGLLLVGITGLLINRVIKRIDAARQAAHLRYAPVKVRE